MSTGAASPGEITHAFSLSGGHMAWAIATGKKRMENRKFRIKPGWYGFGVTLTAHTGVLEDKWYREKYRGPNGYPGSQAFENMKGKIVGACYVNHSLPHESCKDDEYAVEMYPIKNIITKVIPLVSVIPARGNFGTWPLSIEARDELRLALGRLLAPGPGVILETNAKEVYPPSESWDNKTKTPYEGDGGQAKATPKAKAKVSTKSAAKAQAGAASKSKKTTVTSKSKPKKTIEKNASGQIPVAPPKRKPVPKAVESEDDDDVPAARGAATGDIRSFFGKK